MWLFFAPSPSQLTDIIPIRPTLSVVILVIFFLLSSHMASKFKHLFIHLYRITERKSSKAAIRCSSKSIRLDFVNETDE